jgi:hypothetical protein
VTRPTTTGFWFEGAWRELKDPDGPPSGRQLQFLCAHGCLEIIEPGTAAPLTKGECAAAINTVKAIEK